MLIIGTEKVYTMMEIFNSARKHITENDYDTEGISIMAACLAIALGEDVDFIKGAIK